MNELIVNDEILFGEDHNKLPLRKKFLGSTDTKILTNYFYQPRRSATHIVDALLGKGNFPFPKDHNVLAEWIDYVTPQFRKEDETDPPVVLDFFAGSGSTGHAVLQLNKQDGLSRQFILVTNNEGNICRQVTQPRLKAVMTGVWADGKNHEELNGNLTFFTAGHFEREGEWAPESLEMINDRFRVEDDYVHDYTKQTHASFALKHGSPYLVQNHKSEGYSVWCSNPNSEESDVVVVYYDIDKLSSDDFFDVVVPVMNNEYSGTKAVCVPVSADGTMYIEDIDPSIEPSVKGWKVVRVPDSALGAWKASVAHLNSTHSTNYVERIETAIQNSK